jgi:hypothetical protein
MSYSDDEPDPVITIKKINNEVITPMKYGAAVDTRPVKGAALFPEVYANIFLCARKKSGKTIVIQKILRDCTGPNTTILAFCSTVNKDANWLALRRWAEQKGISFEGFASIKEHGVDFLEQFLHRLEDEADEEVNGGGDDSDGDEHVLDLFGDGRYGGGKDEVSDEDDPRPRAKPKREKFQAPEYIIVLDDISHELKLPSLVALLKKNRHYKLKVIVSSQYIHDLKPESIKQMDYLLLFKGLTEDKLEKVLKDADLSCDLETLKKMYMDATSEKYSFLYVDTRGDTFRKKFDKEYRVN